MKEVQARARAACLIPTAPKGSRCESPGHFPSLAPRQMTLSWPQRPCPPNRCPLPQLCPDAYAAVAGPLGMDCAGRFVLLPCVANRLRKRIGVDSGLERRRCRGALIGRYDETNHLRQRPPQMCNIPSVSRDKSNHPAECLVGSASEEVEHDECGRIDWLARNNSQLTARGDCQKAKERHAHCGIGAAP